MIEGKITWAQDELKSTQTDLHLAKARLMRKHAVLQLLFLAGVGLTIGPTATLGFFMRKKNWKVVPHFLAFVPLNQTSLV